MSCFELIPAIDLLGGKCVRLSQGRYDRATVYGDAGEPLVNDDLRTHQRLVKGNAVARGRLHSERRNRHDLAKSIESVVKGCNAWSVNAVVVGQQDAHAKLKGIIRSRSGVKTAKALLKKKKFWSGPAPGWRAMWLNSKNDPADGR